MAQKEDENYDIIIVGAGVAGLYSAYQFIQYGFDPKRILVLERLNRVGGLLKSDLVDIGGYVIKQEEGGMRFMSKTLTEKIIKEVGLGDQIVDFQMASDANLNNVRGCRFTNKQARENLVWYDIFNTELTKKEIEANPLPDILLNSVFQRIVDLNGHKSPTTPQEWQYARLNWDILGKKLYEWDFGFLLRKMGLTYESIRMIQQTIGFKSVFNRNINAGVGFQLTLDFSSDPKFYTLLYGYNQLPISLCKIITEKGAKVKLLCEVQILREDDTNKIYPIKIQYCDSNSSKPFNRTIRCNRCILALPKIALQSLAEKNDWMNQAANFSSYVDSVISLSLTKIDIYFESQWWDQLGFSDGPSFTDLNLGSVYIFNSIRDPKVRKGTSDQPGSLTIYCDYQSSFYWHSMQSIGEDFIPKDNVKAPEDSVLAKKIVVEAIMDELTQLFQMPNYSPDKQGSNKILCTKNPITPPDPVLATYTHWTEPRFGDSPHAWKVSSDDGKISPGVYNLLGKNIAIIGETYSLQQGWVEGALLHTDDYFARYVDLKKSDASKK
ncbi:hypothetical protein LOD99_1958 [Oopsacas minuta]|uniref:Amine oxidase domain-containing protein n=1 Tax=Oopsacas minuta TaxID=111878 RepID=A0AAV7K3J1_9METZ|nr:hypothetical protein LOD99_1958 [Oopsacas minuta]